MNRKTKDCDSRLTLKEQRFLTEWLVQYPKPFMLFKKAHPKLYREAKWAIGYEEVNSLCLSAIVRAIKTYRALCKFATYALYAMRSDVSRVVIKTKRHRMTDDFGGLQATDTIQIAIDNEYNQHVNRNILTLLASSGLNERYIAVLIQRFGLDGIPPRTAREVAKDIGFTIARTTQIEWRALQKLRSKWDADLFQEPS